MSYTTLLRALQKREPQAHTILRSGMASRVWLACDLLRSGQNVVFFARNRDESAQVRALATLFMPEMAQDSKKTPRPAWEYPWVFFPSTASRALNRHIWAERLAALYALRQGRGARAIVITPESLLLRQVPLDFFETQELRIRKNDDISPEMLLEQAIIWGYERMPVVGQAGECARRGDILDIFPPGYEKPLRLEFFGDSLDEMRLFDPATQRSIANLDEMVLLPVLPLRQDEAGKNKAVARWNRLFQKNMLSEQQLRGLQTRLERGSSGLLPGIVFDASTVIEEWLPRASWLLPGRVELEDAINEADQRLRTQLAEQAEEWSLVQPPALALRGAAQACTVSASVQAAYAEPLALGIEFEGEELAERTYFSFTDLFNAPGDQDRPWQRLVSAFKEWQHRYQQAILCFASDRGRQKFLALAERDGLCFQQCYNPTAKGLFALVAPFRSGVELVWANILLVGEDVIQPRGERPLRSSEAFKGMERHDNLLAGDLLVHRDYGIARFGGLHHLQLGAVSNDFLLLEYSGEDKLYLPVDRLSCVQRFKGDGEPALDKLGGAAWQNSKEKARKAIEKVAEDLLEMYAYRKVAKGFRYSPLGELYHEFEASFGFEETPDQARAIQDVLNDMEKPEPMDRLVCGDVGFGKTEVALRAAFRAASEGRQVALLCPTTVLAEQHYQTFRARLANFPINVGLLSRFVSKQKQSEVLAAAAKGQVDILIGTHRILSKDVVLPNLGLVVMDEEQRFGVRHKEQLKEYKKTVDALTLTATPIPRTLQLSMSGIRELSVIETAPPERKPVATALLKRDKAMLRQVLEREIAREGQVFWVHNRVQGLERVAAEVRELVPQARVGMAHGQMSESALEGSMHKFWHGELDVLVCTAIVESGLDFPRANTLVVDGAQMFGLGQLYQLRGRVGRSDRQAYAVFVVADPERLPDLTRERMRIILELDYLGAGFQVAMEDLRLRGAGNILGEVQSGHMTRVGIDLYLEMLEEAVSKLKGQPMQSAETEINLGVSAHIPEQYITDARERLRYYKSLSTAQNGAAREELALEMRDRFGVLPQEVETFLSVLDLKRFLSDIQVLKADVFEERVRIVWAEGQNTVSPEKLIHYVDQHRRTARLIPPASLELQLDMQKSYGERLKGVRNTLEAMRIIG